MIPAWKGGKCCCHSAIPLSTSESGELSVLRAEGATDVRPQIARALVAASVDLYRLDRVGDRLESIFLKLTAGAPSPSANKEAA